MIKRLTILFTCILIFAARIVRADDNSQTSLDPRFEGDYQTTAISQTLFRFPSAYEGPNSLRSRNETEITQVSLLSGKLRVIGNLLADVDLAYGTGKGVGGGNSTGLAGFTNDQAIRVSTVSETPYFARCFLQWSLPFSRSDRLTVTAGKFAVNDVFDTNSYANNADAQFINWGVVTDLAYDFAADTRGYSRGIAIQWIHPSWTLRLGSFQMPVKANAIQLSNDLSHSRGDQIELELHPQIFGTPFSNPVIRLLAYQNHAHMGNYNEAIALSGETGVPPDIVAVERVGAVKYGFAFNGEQALADGGETGVFLRYGWNNGQTESFAYTEADRALSFGAQISGKNWKAPLDHLGIALQQNDLYSSHEQYLALGGLGFQLGDGQLNYGSEKIMETYYSHAFSNHYAASMDYQHVDNPGYNRDRGPVSVLSVRFHVQY